MATTRPSFDPELAPFHDAYPLPAVLSLELLPAIRPQLDAAYTVESVLGDRPFIHQVEYAEGSDGHKVPLAVFTPKSATDKAGSRPCIYFIHAGGLILSNRYCGVGEVLGVAEEISATVVSVEYRLVPEHPAPAALDDSFQGLTWVHENAAKLGIDPANIAVWGSSAGGGLAAAITLLARDRKSQVKPRGLLLNTPMLEDKIDEAENKVFSGEAAKIWSAESNVIGWKAYLGDDAANSANPYYVPARAADLSGLPPTFLDVGTAELFRKPVVRFAEKIWESAGDVELHVWPGAFHSSDFVVPDAAVSKKSLAARKAFIYKILSS
ncbi:unnamed protein product [Clonostachys rosea]|uniref:Alpha/beta hydrolase fold-3 domain-containing protein n=1 Tax=Bionectria ochroleuca TaxID=29856 RepID=A0ABY6UTZ5_BIOOC|nr:unnamed protein product [Clonostachys rosea]